VFFPAAPFFLFMHGKDISGGSEPLPSPVAR